MFFRGNADFTVRSECGFFLHLHPLKTLQHTSASLIYSYVNIHQFVCIVRPINEKSIMLYTDSPLK